jgi:two-component sensor histidine kinase
MPLSDLLQMASTSSNWIPAIFTRNGETVHARMRGLRLPEDAPPCVLITSANDTTTPFLAHAQQIKKLNKQLAVHRKMSEELQTSIEVSKVLERELVHRVKNNLAIISGLLNQQARSTREHAVSAALRDAASRIKSVAIVHDILDASHETDMIDLGKVISELTDGIREALCPNHIRLESETRSVIAHIDVALPLSLLINELVTNAIKHAFPKQESGRIHVRSSLRDTVIEIRVADDGIGLPEGKTRQPRMITALAEQVGGTIESRIENGTEWILRIPFNR